MDGKFKEREDAVLELHSTYTRDAKLLVFSMIAVIVTSVASWAFLVCKIIHLYLTK